MPKTNSIAVGSTIHTDSETFVVLAIETKHNYRSGLSEPYVIASGLLHPVARVTTINGQFWTC